MKLRRWAVALQSRDLGIQPTEMAWLRFWTRKAAERWVAEAATRNMHFVHQRPMVSYVVVRR